MPDSIIGNEFLPNVHIEEISYQMINTQSSRARVTVAIYDSYDRSWSADNKFKGYLSVRVLGAFSSTLIERLSSGKQRTNQPRLTNLFVEEVISDFIETDVYIDGIRYRKFYSTRTLLFTTTPYNLSIFANSEIDLQDLKDNENLNLSFAPQNYLGALTCEDVLRQGQQVKMANIFYDEEGDPYAGPVHLHNDTVYMEGSRHVLTPHATLKLSKTINNKLKYLPNLSYRTEGVPVTPRPSSPVNGSTTYEQDYVQDADGDVSCTFMTDLYSVSLQESRVASIIQNNDPEIFQRIAANLNIKNIEINRHALKQRNAFNSFNLPAAKIDMENSTLIAKSYNNNKKVKEKTLYQISSTEKLSIEPKSVQSSSKTKIFDGKEITQDILKQGIKIGSIQQLNLTLPRNIRPIAFTDHQIKEIRGLEYGFSVKMQIEDDFLKYVKNLLKELTSHAYKLQNFYNVLTAKNAYDGDKFTIDFLISYYSQYGIEVDEITGTILSEIDREKLKNIFIFKAFEHLMEAEKLIGVKVQSDRLLESFNLFTTSMDAINMAIRYYDKTIDNFRRVYSVSSEKNYGKTNSVTPRKDRPLIEKIIKLKKTYKKPQLPKIGFNYISMDRHKGVKKINLSELTARADVETNKFFKTAPTKASPLLASLSEDNRKSFIDISSNKFKHFSPSRIFFGNKEVDTTSLNPESMEVSFFNNLKITRSLMEGTTEEEYSLKDIEEEQTLYIDSREYLGEDTKFNDAIIRALRRNPLKLNAIRKEFKLLDKSILKTKTKKVSLDSFDLSAKNNIVKKAFAKAPTEIPIQIKALSMLRSKSTNFSLDNLQFDPLANPQTDETIKQNFMNIGKLEYLDGFESANGIPMLNKPIFKEISLKNLQHLQNKNVLCQIKNTNFDNLTIDDSSNFQIFDKTFTLESTKEDQMDIGEVQPLSEDNSDLVEIFADTLLSPAFYSSNIVSQNADNASVVDPLNTRGEIVQSTQTATVQTNIQTVQTTPRGGSY